MSKIEKLIGRLKSRPKDFTWEEMTRVLKYYGYEEMPKGKTGGSRRKFINNKKLIISLHEPHPKNILKAYQLEIIIQHLEV
jgi:hypothetical protein